jgi:hypothetical protein
MSDGAKIWIGCLFPGLGRAWWYGSPGGLAASLVFVAILNVAIVATFGWTEWIGTSTRTCLWVILSLFWCGGAVLGYRLGRAEDHTGPVDETDEFARARCEYLQGNWYDTEEILKRLLRRDGRDVETRLMLATLYRRTQRPDQSRQSLDQLDRYAAAQRWQHEIRRERELIERDDVSHTENNKSDSSDAEQIVTENTTTVSDRRHQRSLRAA